MSLDLSDVHETSIRDLAEDALLLAKKGRLSTVAELLRAMTAEITRLRATTNITR